MQPQTSEPSLSTIQLDGEPYGHGLAAGNPFKTGKMDGLANPMAKDYGGGAAMTSAKAEPHNDGQFRLDNGVYERLREELGRMRRAASASSESDGEDADRLPPSKQFRDESSGSSEGKRKVPAKGKSGQKMRKASDSGSPRGIGLQNQKLKVGKKKQTGMPTDGKKGQMEKTAAFIERMRPKPLEKQAAAAR